MIRVEAHNSLRKSSIHENSFNQTTPDNLFLKRL